MSGSPDDRAAKLGFTGVGGRGYHLEWGGQDLLESGPLSVYRSFDEYTESGAIGHPTLASAEIYERLGDELERMLTAVHEQNR